jgi:hypothetical protein
LKTDRKVGYREIEMLQVVLHLVSRRRQDCSSFATTL